MSWSNRSKVAASICAVGGAYGIWRFLQEGGFLEKKSPIFGIRDDIIEEEVNSDEDFDIDERVKMGHGDQLGSSPENVEIDQLLHLLRVSLPHYHSNPKSENNITVALQELILKSRYFNNIEEMLDSEIIPQLMECLETQNMVIITKTCELINNISTCNAGLALCSSLVGILIFLLEKYISDPIDSVPIMQCLFTSLSNVICNPAYDETNNEDFNRIFTKITQQYETATVRNLLDGSILKLSVNLSAQPSANPVLIESGFVLQLEKSFNSLLESQFSLRSDFILRSLYIFQNLILFKNGNSWMPSRDTMERVNRFSSSMDLSPAIVERALSIVRSV